MIYFIRRPSDSLIKIGMTEAFRSRFNLLLNQYEKDLEILGFMDGGRAEEMRVHGLFSHGWVRGEWFTPLPELQKFIEENTHKPSTDFRGSKSHSVTMSDELIDAIERFSTQNNVSTSQGIRTLIGCALSKLDN